MQAISLQSGSNGNCIYVESGGVRLLFDAGISGIQTLKRLAIHDRDIRQVDALIISHDHSDHTSAMGILARKFGIPVYVTEPTLAAAVRKNRIGDIPKICHFESGKTIDFGSVSIHTLPTPHDGVDGVGFVVDDGKCRLGILTDLGYIFPELIDAADSLDGVFIESNYDMHMLETGPYPLFLKKRISGSGGHLSNLESAELLAGLTSKRLRWACLSHLSEMNNTPEEVIKTHRLYNQRKIPLSVASRYNVSPVFNLD
jgi:phosphoribosyl 1,2-cyclic phosphodiesterase